MGNSNTRTNAITFDDIKPKNLNNNIHNKTYLKNIHKFILSECSNSDIDKLNTQLDDHNIADIFEPCIYFYLNALLMERDYFSNNGTDSRNLHVCRKSYAKSLDKSTKFSLFTDHLTQCIINMENKFNKLYDSYQLKTLLNSKNDVKIMETRIINNLFTNKEMYILSCKLNHLYTYDKLKTAHDLCLLINNKDLSLLIYT